MLYNYVYSKQKDYKMFREDGREMRGNSDYAGGDAAHETADTRLDNREDILKLGKFGNGARETQLAVKDAGAELGRERKSELGLDIERRLDNYGSAVNLVSTQLGEDAGKRVAGEIARIENVELNTLSAMEARGEALAPETLRAARELSIIGVNAYNLTPEETKAVSDFSANATEDIQKKKVEKVADALFHSINGVRATRDGTSPAFYNPLETLVKDDMRERYRQYSEGKLDLSRGFSVEAVLDRKYADGDLSPSEIEELRATLEDEDNFTTEELLEAGYIEEQDLYRYGPFTGRDLENVDFYKTRTWSELTPDQSVDGLSALLNKTVQPHTDGLESDLLYDFISSEVMSSRRLNASEMITSAAAAGLSAIEEYGKDMPDMLKSSLSYLSYYAANMLTYRTDELKARFNAARPVNVEFYKEIANAVANLPEGRKEYLDKNYTGYLERMDDHLMNVLDMLKVKDVGESALFSDEDD